MSLQDAPILLHDAFAKRTPRLAEVPPVEPVQGEDVKTLRVARRNGIADKVLKIAPIGVQDRDEVVDLHWLAPVRSTAGRNGRDAFLAFWQQYILIAFCFAE